MKKAFLIVDLLELITMIIVLNYMKTRFYLNSNEYKKEDIEFN